MYLYYKPFANVCKGFLQNILTKKKSDRLALDYIKKRIRSKNERIPLRGKVEWSIWTFL